MKLFLQVKIWFQNRRSKQKKLCKGNGEPLSGDEDSLKDPDMSPPNSVATSIDGHGSNVSNTEENHRNSCNNTEQNIIASSSTPVSLSSNLINPIPVSQSQQQHQQQPPQQQPLQPSLMQASLLGVDSNGIDWSSHMNMLPGMANTLASTSLPSHPHMAMHMQQMQLSPHQLSAATTSPFTQNVGFVQQPGFWDKGSETDMKYYDHMAYYPHQPPPYLTYNPNTFS
uniref:Homeobox domain-containing protein n=1 Tax=Panagrolaimus sp. ES5 TaxID=591445 RepID=A0AC34GX03_9BILA